MTGYDARMDLKLVVALISIGITASGYYFYFRDIFAGRTRPHAYTWLVWASLTAIAFFGQIHDGAGAGAWITGLTAAVSFVIFGLALSKGEKEITRLDKLSLLSAMFALALWPVTSDPLLSMVLVTATDFLGFVPPIRKSYGKPHEETLVSYVLAGLKFALAIIALENYTVVTWLYPASLVVANLAFVFMLVIRRRKVTAPF